MCTWLSLPWALAPLASADKRRVSEVMALAGSGRARLMWGNLQEAAALATLAMIFPGSQVEEVGGGAWKCTVFQTCTHYAFECGGRACMLGICGRGCVCLTFAGREKSNFLLCPKPQGTQSGYTAGALT